MYSVIIAAPAEADLRQQHDWWSKNRSAEQAARWYVGIIRALLTLESGPQEYPRIADAGPWPVPLRQLNFGLGRKPTHRAVFTIREQEVFVLRVRHLAQAELTIDDI